jgi:hypothetical protein
VNPIDLTSLLSLDSDLEALDAFVSGCLCDGGIWTSPRNSDGIQGVERVLERAADCLRLCGRIYSIDQVLHPFWLELWRDAVEPSVTWMLCFDLAEGAGRRAQNAFTASERSEDIEWRVVLGGEAAIDNGALTLVAGATRTLARDVSQFDETPTRPRRQRR